MIQQCLPYTIRPMELGDIPTVVAIDQLSFPTPWSTSSYSYELRHAKTSFYYVLLKPATNKPAPPKQGWRQWFLDPLGYPRRESRVIGYMGFRLQVPGVHISTLAVHPDWRGNGLGELLLLTALEEAVAKGLTSVTLEVRASNHVAQHLYRKYGFQFTGVHQGYYRDGEDAWLMKVELDEARHQTRLTVLRQVLAARLRQQQPGERSTLVGQNTEGRL